MRSLSLAGEWRLAPAEATCLPPGTEIPCVLPGDVHSSLLAAGLIPDPCWGSNEARVQWVGRTGWTAWRDLEVSRDDLASGRAVLVMTMADTFITVLVNGSKAGSCLNQFREWAFDLTGLLREGANRVELRFRSPEKAALQEASKLPYPIPCSVYPGAAPHRNLIRKTQCHSGWDWGPCLMAMGVYGDIRIDFLPEGRILSVLFRTVPLRGGAWRLEAEGRFEAWEDGVLPCALETDLGTVRKRVPVAKGPNSFVLGLVCRSPELWWPSGQGPRRLYAARLSAGSQTVERRVGFRTIEVADGPAFVVNGRPVFAKGANWIPPDALPSRLTRRLYGRLLQDCVDANMNMVRVWGGGMYEKDFFYDLCDEKGLLVWQDCMFACGLYPSTPAFLANVAEELAYQVPRLGSHPCLALWCGNNENLQALSWYPEAAASPGRYIDDYKKLYEGVVGPLVRKLDPGRTFRTSSPMGGDEHCWAVWHEGKTFEHYLEVEPRFVSEFGYQSFPSLSTVRSFAPEEDLHPGSPALEGHQKNPRGNSIIEESLERCFRPPASFERMLYLSQAQQAWAIRTAVERWRALRPRCMGTLYWQLDDNWPAVSWSSIDHSGKWKLLHHAARRFYAPVLPVAWLKDGVIQAFLLNDGASPLEDGVFTLDTALFDGRRLSRRSFPLCSPPAGSSTHVCSLPLDQLGAAPGDAYLRIGFEGGDVSVRNTLLLDLPRRCALRPSRLEVSAEPAEGGFAVDVRCGAPAFWVSLDAGPLEGRFDDNWMDLAPEAPRRVVFRMARPCSLEEFQSSLGVCDLWSAARQEEEAANKA